MNHFNQNNEVMLIYFSIYFLLKVSDTIGILTKEKRKKLKPPLPTYEKKKKKKKSCPKNKK